MKRVFVLRHAKSDWGAEYGEDHERPLAKRGVRAARAVGALLSALDAVPHTIVTSSAVRALGTARLAAEAGEWDSEITVAKELYHAGPETALEKVREQSVEIGSVMLVGHEPTCSELVGRLIGRADVKMVTAALARVDFAVERWADVDFGRGLLAWLVTPKLLDRASRPVP